MDVCILTQVPTPSASNASFPTTRRSQSHVFLRHEVPSERHEKDRLITLSTRLKRYPQLPFTMLAPPSMHYLLKKTIVASKPSQSTHRPTQSDSNLLSSHPPLPPPPLRPAPRIILTRKALSPLARHNRLTRRIQAKSTLLLISIPIIPQ